MALGGLFPTIPLTFLGAGRLFLYTIGQFSVSPLLFYPHFRRRAPVLVYDLPFHGRNEGNQDQK